MTDLFSVTAPLSICAPSGEKSIMAAVYPHPQGLLYFDLFWDIIEQSHGLKYATHIIEGSIRGEGPWKIGNHVIQILGCQGSEPELAQLFSQWQMHFEQQGFDDSSKGLLKDRAREFGGIVEDDRNLAQSKSS